MKTLDGKTLEQGAAISKDLTKQRLLATLAMLGSAAVAFLFAGVIAPTISGFPLSIAAATGLSVGGWCAPHDYRTRTGSIALASGLVASGWTFPAVVSLTSLLGGRMRGTQ